MGFAKLVLPDQKSSNGYRSMKYYKNTRSINNLVRYALAKDKDYIKDSRVKPKVRYCDSNCVDISDPRKAVEQIKAVQKFFKKTDGRKMYHYILSFPDEIKDAKEVYEAGLEIMNKFFNEYQTIFAVHEDTDHLHIHFVFNSVSYLTGKKWCINFKEFYWLKEDIECMANSHFHKNDIMYLLE